jgi:hypothetical protein
MRKHHPPFLVYPRSGQSLGLLINRTAQCGQSLAALRCDLITDSSLSTTASLPCKEGIFLFLGIFAAGLSALLLTLFVSEGYPYPTVVLFSLAVLDLARSRLPLNNTPKNFHVYKNFLVRF